MDGFVHCALHYASYVGCNVYMLMTLYMYYPVHNVIIRSYVDNGIMACMAALRMIYMLYIYVYIMLSYTSRRPQITIPVYLL